MKTACVLLALLGGVSAWAEKGGAKVEDVTVVRQGNRVTASGPEAADEFAKTLVAALAGGNAVQASTNAPAGCGK